MEVSSINQNPINMQVASFMVDTLEDLVDMVVHCSHSVEPFFCGGGGELVFIIEVYSAWIKAIETSIGGEFVGSGGCSIIGNFYER